MRRTLWTLAMLTIMGWNGPGVTVEAGNWGSWRGPQQNGVSSEQGLPVTWSTTENVAWKLPLPGPGGATPVVWGDRIFVSSVAGNDLVLLSIDTQGKLLWQKRLGSGNRDVRGDEGNSASASPTTDGQHVWVQFANGLLSCLDYDGNMVWQVDLGERYGELQIQFGLTSSPVLDGDRLYLQLIHSGGAKVVALNKLTGAEIWQVPRPSNAREECEHSYASPSIYRDSERSYLLTHGADYIVAHDLDTGRELWRCGGLHPPAGYDLTLRFVSSPAAVPGMIIVPSAKLGKLVCLKPDQQGDLTDRPEAHLWQFERTPDVPSPLIVPPFVYLCRENGNLIALDAATGKQLYEKRTHADRHRASPVYADGKIYLSARDGTISVVEAGPEFKLIAQNNMNESISASPAISNGRIYIRTFGHLYAVGK
ncbi:MAG: PQQ-binding-like beta-propeller repeat protein [Pirellulales bacterium]